MENFKLKKVVAFLVALAIPVTFSGCSKRSDCEVPSRHVHEYTKETPYGAIHTYIDSEKEEEKAKFKWNPDYIEITNDDEHIFDILWAKNMLGIVTGPLFNGEKNWNYLFNVMKNTKDYFEFYYEYYTTETYTTTDSNGKTEVHTRRVHHDGWHTNPNDSDNTGKTRLCHYRFRGYRVVFKDGEYKIESSKLVDDIRDIIDDYQYYSEDPTEIVCKYYNFRRSELRKLRVENFQNEFGHPRIDTDEIHIKDKVMEKKR